MPTADACAALPRSPLAAASAGLQNACGAAVLLGWGEGQGRGRQRPLLRAAAVFSLSSGLISSSRVCGTCACRPWKPAASLRCPMPWAKASRPPPCVVLTSRPERCRSLPLFIDETRAQRDGPAGSRGSGLHCRPVLPARGLPPSFVGTPRQQVVFSVPSERTPLLVLISSSLFTPRGGPSESSHP